MNYERDKVVRLLGGTYLGESLAGLSALYDQIEDETNAFCTKYGIRCGEGCGTCCEHFMPDITGLEARMVAAYLLLIRNDLPLIDTLEHSLGSDHCPLFDPENPHHCKVYAARPLICRLFGACASLSKDGVAEFRHCKYNAVKTMPEHLVFFESVPVMSAYGIQLRALDGGEGVVEDLSEAVTEALSIVRLLWSLIGRTMDDDDSTPSPMAS